MARVSTFDRSAGLASSEGTVANHWPGSNELRTSMALGGRKAAALGASKSPLSARISLAAGCGLLGNGVAFQPATLHTKSAYRLRPSQWAPLHRKAAGGYRQGANPVVSQVESVSGWQKAHRKGACSAEVMLRRMLEVLPTRTSLVNTEFTTPLCHVRRKLRPLQANTSDAEPVVEMTSDSPSERADNAASQAASSPPEPESDAGPLERIFGSEDVGTSLDDESSSNGGVTSQGEEDMRGYRRETVLPHRQLREEVKGRRSTKPWRPNKPERRSVSHDLAQSHYKNQVSGPSGREREPWLYETDSEGEEEEEERDDYLGPAPHLDKLPEPRRGFRKATKRGQVEVRVVRGARLDSGLRQPSRPKRRSTEGRPTAVTSDQVRHAGAAPIEIRYFAWELELCPMRFFRSI